MGIAQVVGRGSRVGNKRALLSVGLGGGYNSEKEHQEPGGAPRGQQEVPTALLSWGPVGNAAEAS
eukprot:3044768-Pyramimonas_sp.AAC.1